MFPSYGPTGHGKMSAILAALTGSPNAILWPQSASANQLIHPAGRRMTVPSAAAPAAVQQPDPIRAVKGAHLYARPTPYGARCEFGAVGYTSQHYPAGLTTAVCAAAGSHGAPQWDCTCGWWAVNPLYPELVQQGDALDTWLLDVELYGRVIEQTLLIDPSNKVINVDTARHVVASWRAEKQRVLAVTAPSWCGAVDERLLDSRIPQTCEAPAPYICIMGTGLNTRCAEHARNVVPLAWLRDQLGLDVRGEFLARELPAELMARKLRPVELTANINAAGPDRLPKTLADHLASVSPTWYRFVIPIHPVPLTIEAAIHGDGLTLSMDHANGRRLWQRTLVADMPAAD